MKPRLTAKVLKGLSYIAGSVEAGAQLDEGGELEDFADEVNAALKWVTAMVQHRAADK